MTDRPTSTGRVALVTGASSGIGAATARLLAAQGTAVAVVARRAERLEAVVADCLPSAPGSRAYPADLSDPEGAAELARTVWDDLGAIDVLVNNAGVPLRRPVQRLTMDEVRRAMTVNYFSPVAMVLALLPRMVARGSGTIVNVSSVGGRMGIATESAYCGSKFALSGFSEALAADLSGTGIAVRLVLPGAIDTEIWDQPGNDAPLYQGPLVPAEEVAEGIVAAIASESFEHYVPDLSGVVEFKTKDFDGYLAGMLAMSAGAVDDETLASRMTPGAATTGGTETGDDEEARS